MASVITNDEYLKNIANAIRSKNKSTDTYQVGEMATAIEQIESGGGSTVSASVGTIQVIPPVTIPTVTATVTNGTVQASSGIYYPCTLPTDYVNGAIYYTYADNVFTVAEVTASTEGTYYRYSNDVVEEVEPSGAIYEETLTFAYDEDESAYLATSATFQDLEVGGYNVEFDGVPYESQLIKVEGLPALMLSNQLMCLIKVGEPTIIGIFELSGADLSGEHTIKILNTNNNAPDYFVGVTMDGENPEDILRGRFMSDFEAGTISLVVTDENSEQICSVEDSEVYIDVWVEPNLVVFYKNLNGSTSVSNAIKYGKTLTFTFTQTKADGNTVTKTITGEPFFSEPMNSYCWGQMVFFVAVGE